MTLKIADVTKFTLQDYPGRLACIVWFAGCDMRCRYCHNADLLDQRDGFLEEEMVLKFLRTKVDLLDGVVLSGGECTLQSELGDFIGKIKDLGFRVKIDTNGLNPRMVRQLLGDRLVDSVALDFKAPRGKFTLVSQVAETLYGNFEDTLHFVLEKFREGSIELEIRTTVHTSLLGEDDINEIIRILDDLSYSGVFYLQNFTSTGGRTLVDLGNQIRQLDRSRIVKPKHFSLGFRNF
ncbi:MAG: anaerobic ribonucleoside-triphosphate reductase activating protein [Rickettsiales bacterium]|jgi:pyruvate formate lyase activating enzyme|nr:anaerobic ribonucleoside-triphosphate reductase activating protein [Rickettsiales bacterium]